jgi:N-acetylmuramoyl-L-alanine amidase
MSPGGGLVFTGGVAVKRSRRRELPAAAVSACLLVAGACSGGQTTTAPTPAAGDTTSSSPAATVSTTAAPPPPPARALEGVVIAVDPGHNGANGSHPAETSRLVDAGGFQKRCNTTGTSASGVTESEVNWQVANRLTVMLEAAGATVVPTRTDDSGWGPCIDERGQIAARAGAAALISLHADGADSAASGFHIIHPAVRSGYTDATAERSEALAAAVRDELVARGWSTSGHAGAEGLHRRDDIGTLNRAEVPAIMIEAGNMQNPVDFAKLASAGGQQDLAAAVVAALEGISRLAG